MSTIYEALLRAEMERIAELNRSHQAGDLSDTSSGGDQPVEPASNDAESAGYLAGPAERQVMPRSSLSGVEVLERDVVPLHLERPANFVPTKTVWHPERNALPALENRGPLVEQIRVLRSRLHELRLDRPLKTIIVTSGLPQEGKSFVAVNLAVGFAKFRNQRVLLIDADMRRGRLHKVLGAPQEPGLTDYLAKRAPLSKVAQQMDGLDAGPFKSLASLTFIPSGRDADNAADLSGNGRFDILLREAYNEFDWIIIDSSPVTLVTDSVNLARACDGVVMVARGGVTKYEVAQRAVQALKATRIVGVVLNAVEGLQQVGYYGYDG